MAIYKHFKISFRSTLSKALVKSINTVYKGYLPLLTYLCIRVCSKKVAYKVFLAAINPN